MQITGFPKLEEPTKGARKILRNEVEDYIKELHLHIEGVPTYLEKIT